MGALEDGDLLLIGGDEMPDIAAILLGIILGDPEECVAWIGRVARALRNQVALRLAVTAQIRVQRGRLISAIG